MIHDFPFYKHRFISKTTLFQATMLRSVALLSLIGLCAQQALAYCPDFMRNQTACTCIEYIDGAIIRCNGPG